MKHVLNDVGNACLWASSIMIVIWVIQYTILAPWYKNFLGITIVGEALALLAIFIPSLMALADPAQFARFSTTAWYLWLTVGIVVATTVFIGSRIVIWELLRRHRGGDPTRQLPAAMAERIMKLETENATLRERLGQR